jgi:hypothetical protein
MPILIAILWILFYCGLIFLGILLIKWLLAKIFNFTPSAQAMNIIYGLLAILFIIWCITTIPWGSVHVGPHYR